MNTTVIDNEDYLVMIWAPVGDPLLALEKSGALGAVHKLEDNLWMARVSFANAKAVQAGLKEGAYKMLVIRYTSETTYFSDNQDDQSQGRHVTG